jgi:hypothetical protein
VSIINPLKEDSSFKIHLLHEKVNGGWVAPKKLPKIKHD